MRRTILFFLSAFFLFGNTFGYFAHAAGMEMTTGTEQEGRTLSQSVEPGGCEGNRCCGSETDCVFRHELKEDSAFSLHSNIGTDFPRNSISFVPRANLTKKIVSPCIPHITPAEFLTEKQLK